MKLWILFLIYGLFILGVKSVWLLSGDALLLAVIYLAFFEEDFRKCFLIVLMLGFLVDVLSMSPLGVGPLSYGIIFLLVRFFRTAIFFRSFPARFAWTFLFSLLHSLLGYAGTALFSNLDRPLSFLLKHFFWDAFVNGLFSSFWFLFLKWYRGITWETFFRKKDPLLGR